MTIDPLDKYPAMMTPAEVAREFRTPEGVLANWRQKGGGPPYVKVTPGRNGRVLYPREEVRAFYAERLRQGAGAAS
jgi:hypothetical protein